MWQFFYCATCHNFESSLTIILNDGDQYFKKTFIQKSLYATCEILMDGWKLVMVAWYHGCSCEVAY